LTWYERGPVLVVSSEETVSERELRTRVYPVGDIIAQRRIEPDVLTDAIQKEVAPQSWEVNCGTGAMDSFAPAQALVCLQTLALHEEVEGFLAATRAGKGRR